MAVISFLLLSTFGILVKASDGYIVATGAEQYSTAFSNQRKLALTSDGHLHAVYHRKDSNDILQIYHSESTDEGETWTEEQITNATRDQNLPALAVDSQNRLHLVWQDGKFFEPGIIPNVLYKVKTNEWQDTEHVASYAQCPAIAVDTYDNVHVVYGPYVYSPGIYGGGDGKRWRERTSAGWQTEERFSEDKYWSPYQAIAIDGNNDVHVVFSHGPTAYYDVHYRKRTFSGWETEIEINTEKDNNRPFPLISIDSKNHIHVVWLYESPAGNYYIRYRQYTTSWQPIIDLEGPTTYSQGYPTIATDRKDNIHVVWYGQHSDSPTLYQIRCRSYTTSWLPIEELTSSTLYNQTYPSLMWGFYPIIGGVKINQPEDGYAFIWMDGTTIKYWKPESILPLSVSISPLSASILVGQSVNFTSTVSGGSPSYNYQWYLNGSIVLGATSSTWTFKPTNQGEYMVNLNVTDSLGSVAISETAVISVAPQLAVSIYPLSASVIVGQTITFTSTVTGGYTPYTYQWYLNDNPVSGATSPSWAFTPTTNGIYYIYLKVTDDKGNIAQSDTARITATIVPVGGCSFPIPSQTKAEPIIPYIALVAALTVVFTKLKPKTKRKH
ncbi:MAG: PKD domain-containing protein [Candidatus Bathyarchaeia archaeon]